MKRFEHKLTEKNFKIGELESKFAMKQTTIDNTETKCDVNKQYTRKSFVRIHGLDFNSDEDNNIMKK